MVTGGVPIGLVGPSPVYAEGEISDQPETTDEQGSETPDDPTEETPETLDNPEPTPETPDEPTPEPKPVAPKVPQIKVSVKGAGLTIKWDKLKGATSYRVYRSYKKASGYKLLKKGIKKLSYSDTKVASGKRAYYKVRAVKKGGSYTGYSAVKSGVIYRVYIETGHGTGDDGKWDPGCIWSKYQEARLMIPICKATAKHLRSKGVYVYTDAFSNNNINLKVTLQKVKKYDVSVLLNVHCDYRYAPRGTMPLYRYSDQKKLAKCLNNGVHKYVKIQNRGLKKRTDLDTLNKSKGYCVACLFETGNIKKDNKILRTKYDAYGKGLARGVCDYLGIKW